MYAIQKSRDQQPKCRPNILPCCINHNGPVNASKRHWSPTVSDGKTLSYFRGRKLHGRTVKVPEGYKGVILSTTDQKLPKVPRTPFEEELVGNEQMEEVGILEDQAEFGELLIWGHEVLPNETSDPYVRGMEEWIALAEHIHTYSSGSSEGQKGARQS